MSPNEFQLRSALRDGEGDHVNPDTVIARARGVQQARHDRRVRYGSMAAAVAIVGGIGVVGGIALNGGGDRTSTASKNGAGNQVFKSDQGAAGGRAVNTKPAVAAGPMADAAAIPCPDPLPKLMLPGGGGTGQFGARGALFSGPVEAVKVCAYAGSTSGVSPSTTLTAENATNLAKSLEDADTTRSASVKCPASPTAADPGSLVIIGVDTSGNPMKPVVVTLTCPTRVTNGTALRFNWTPPANLTRLIDNGITSYPSGAPISLPPPGKVTGSPIQS